MLSKFIRFQKSYYHNNPTTPLSYKSIGTQLREITKKYPDNIAIVSQLQGKELKYSEFYIRCKELAAAFIALGLEKGDRIGIYSPNNIEWALTQFAASMAGLILVSINSSYQTTELEFTLNKTECKALILKSSFQHSNNVQMIRQLVPEIKESGPQKLKRLPNLKSLILIDDINKKGFINFKDLFSLSGPDHLHEVRQRMDKIDPDSIATIQFTSGTTGQPSAACLSHLNILNNAKYVGETLQYSHKDIVAIPVPLYHSVGNVLGNLACINYGAKMVYPSERFSAAATLEAVANYRCTSIIGVPTMYIEYINEHEKHPHKFDVSSLKTGIITGSLASEGLMKQIINILGIKNISNCYGQTETGPITCQTKIIDSNEIKTTTVGSPLGVEAKIVNKDNKIVDYNTEGEYCVRGYSVMKGYWNDEKTTKEIIDSDGFLHSGDIAKMDQQGNITIVGRNKELIIRGGENVYPKEIEDFLSHMPGIEAVQVVGCHDDILGEEVVALIKLKKGVEEITNLDVYEYCHHQISYFKIPKFVKFVQDIPQTIMGKPKKYKMKEMINKELEDPKLRELYSIR